MTRMIATFGGIGYLRPAPGTWGSLAGLALGIVLHWVGGFALLLLATGLGTALGYWAVSAELGETNVDDDPSEFVIDEVVGQWVALWPVSLGASLTGAEILALYPGIIVAFLAFRLLDITKPGPIGWADRQHGAFGILADDVIAGWIAAMLVALFAFIAHIVFVL